MRNENGPNVTDYNVDCLGKQHGERLSDVATAAATNTARFAATAAATPHSGPRTAPGSR
jgi:hypothetical protein